MRCAYTHRGVFECLWVRVFGLKNSNTLTLKYLNTFPLMEARRICYKIDFFKTAVGNDDEKSVRITKIALPNNDDAPP